MRAGASPPGKLHLSRFIGRTTLDRAMLVSVHIPKAGGTTLKSVLRRKYRTRLLIDYPDHEARKSRIETLMGMLRERPPKAVHGHFCASKYIGRRYITFIRDPVERRASEYNYIRRRYKNDGLIIDEGWANALSISLHEFMEIPDSTYSNLLDIDIRQFSFVGLMDRFEMDMARLCEMLQVSYRPEKANAAKKPTNVTDELRRVFARTNPEEIEYFEEIRRYAD